ncbi:pyrimidine dimer DNA glycosylase/endonuclease V [Rhodanobacter glycinis]|uniref:pyrimidine dimer DNA glycosylase/endonuclease V n=1 Tax=Rhodanobacter glycinis TaxID=582702 RepID=UPI001F4FE7AA|nr:pyrimidine dimer DNA glycosylase/endonuclease V [Rhodanobacter glycinis]
MDIAPEVALVAVAGALLARAVLRGETQGHRQHPQLQRIRQHATPLLVINAYLSPIHAESVARDYSFDRSKIGPVRSIAAIDATTGQLAYEWQCLLQKLATRNPVLHEQWHALARQECHPLFRLRQGPVEPWERHA